MIEIYWCLWKERRACVMTWFFQPHASKEWREKHLVYTTNELAESELGILWTCWSTHMSIITSQRSGWNQPQATSDCTMSNLHVISWEKRDYRHTQQTYNCHMSGMREEADYEGSAGTENSLRYQDWPVSCCACWWKEFPHILKFLELWTRRKKLNTPTCKFV